MLAASWGDNRFVAYSREGNNEFLGRFAIGANGSIDGVQESDGADVINVPLGPNYPAPLVKTRFIASLRLHAICREHGHQIEFTRVDQPGAL